MWTRRGVLTLLVSLLVGLLDGWRQGVQAIGPARRPEAPVVPPPAEPSAVPSSTAEVVVWSDSVGDSCWSNPANWQLVTPGAEAAARPD
jgi:hypothetical protein